MGVRGPIVAKQYAGIFEMGVLIQQVPQGRASVGEIPGSWGL